MSNSLLRSGCWWPFAGQHFPTLTIFTPLYVEMRTSTHSSATFFTYLVYCLLACSGHEYSRTTLNNNQ